MARKAKAPAAPAAQSVAEAADLVARIGEIQRELARRDADLGDAMARVKEVAETLAAPLKAELDQAQARVQGFCEANRALLTKDGRTKTVELTTGKVFWRQRPAAVQIRKPNEVMAYLRSLGGIHKFLRLKVEFDREQMLKEPEDAGEIPGITVGSAGEDFIIEPFEAGLVEAQS